MKRKWMVWLAVGMLILGLGVMLYPTVSSQINRQNGSYAIQELQDRLEDVDAEQMTAALDEARCYNSALIAASETAEPGSYEQILDFGNGIMGYICINKIGVKLPIYHGVTTDVLEKGVGHLPSSAFPIGGAGNHTVLTGHTGLPSAELFTDLTELAEGDVFEITVGSNTISYQVDRIRVVLPSETEDLMPMAGEDLCTLVTCTPYGVNSHRLLVRGSRVELPKPTEAAKTAEEAQPGAGYGWWPLLLIPAVSVIWAVRRKRGRKYD